MINKVVLVGRLTKDPEIVETENTKRTVLVVAVPRTYKNTNGEYEADFIKCILWNAIAECTCEYCHKGDVVGITGRLQTNSYEKDGNTICDLEVITDKISFISSKSTEIKEVQTEK